MFGGELTPDLAERVVDAVVRGYAAGTRPVPRGRDLSSIRLWTAAAVLVLALVPGAMAKEPIPDPQVPLTGAFVDSFSGGTVNHIDAGAPFYVESGWCGFANERVALARPTTRTEISLDGEPLVMGTIVDMHFPIPELGCEYGMFDYDNFRFGLPEGTYTFVASFYWLGEFAGAATTTLIVH